MPFFSIVIAFIIYDVDFVFFFSEVFMLANYGFIAYWVLSCFLLLMFVGLWYDYFILGFS
jgi:NADH:ubiquinone oxidoreductase subunit 3 (subunit A)